MSLNKSRGNMYSWVTHTWNPIKGHCEFECPYCYVRSSARLMMAGKDQLPCYLEEKELTTNLGKDRAIFVGSMGDMWGPWIKDEWIQRVLGRCSQFPLNTYVFQSKNPARLLRFLPWLRNSSTIYLGTTIETDHYCFQTKAPQIEERVEIMHRLRLLSMKTFITIEPIMKFNLEELLRQIRIMSPAFVTIGADSKGHGLVEPTWAEVQALIDELGKLKIEIRQKSNLERLRR